VNNALLDYLACCCCGSRLHSINRNLKCSNCGFIYPIVQGRPIIMTNEMTQEWRSPIDETMGIDGRRTLMDSLRTLHHLGTERSLEMVRRNPVLDESFTPLETVSRKVRGKMLYRGRGEWFSHSGRASRLLSFPWVEDSDGSFSAFMQAISMDSGEVLLDVASGGGFGVSQQVFLNKTAKTVIAVERDLKCLTNIQYRFKHIGQGSIADAVGGDIRHLPVMSSSVDTAMMLGGLPEIFGISRMLREVFRVLKPGGSFHVLVGEEPLSGEGISVEDFCAFAKHADLYAGGEPFTDLAQASGFDVNSRIFSNPDGRKRRLVRLSKVG